MINIDTLFELLSKYKVEIPRVQRDYAQGRSDKHSVSVRETLLRDLCVALNGGEVLDLNFIYGKTEGKKFIPLDGQQRLTTLFLVHLYAFAADKTRTQLLQNFTYETRTSSREFLKALIEHRNAVFSSQNKPSDEISDSDWYQSSWDYDPTVQSIKVVLDDIVTVLGDVDGLCEKLSDTSNEPIRFSFLSMDELGMEDSLYIKMNARGRMLTSFENYKARLISQVQKLYEREVLSIKPHDFKRCLDGDWTDLFWANRRNDFDAAYNDFFKILFVNFANLSVEAGYIESVKFKEINASMIESAFYTLNYIWQTGGRDDASKLIFLCLGQHPTFQERILFYAISAYMLETKGNVDEISLGQWIRIISNMTYNTNEQAVGRAENFGAIIQSINSLLPYCDDLIKHFANQIIELKIFAPPQIEEERIKALLILKGPNFQKKILEAEQHNYFNGQIRSGFLAAGITYEVVKEANDDILKEKMDSFDIYWSKIATLFADKEPIFGVLLRQALLSQKDYTIKTGYYYSFGIDNPNDPTSLKALFADSNHTELIRSILDAFQSTQREEVKKSLENFINNVDIPKNDWRYCFVRYPGLFTVMSKQYMRIFKGENTLIIKNKATNGYNFEVFTYALHRILGERKSEYPNISGGYSDYFIITSVQGRRVLVQFKDGNFVVSYEGEPKTTIFITEKEPLSEIVKFLTED